MNDENLRVVKILEDSENIEFYNVIRFVDETITKLEQSENVKNSFIYKEYIINVSLCRECGKCEVAIREENIKELSSVKKWENLHRGILYNFLMSRIQLFLWILEQKEAKEKRG